MQENEWMEANGPAVDREAAKISSSVSMQNLEKVSSMPNMFIRALFW